MENQKVMRVDGITYSKSNLSTPMGYLQNENQKYITFTKYKSQAQGRTNIIFWIIYKIVMLFRKDKELLRINRMDIKDIQFELIEKKGVLKKMLQSYGNVIIQTTAETYTFPVKGGADPAEVKIFVETIKEVQ